LQTFALTSALGDCRRTEMRIFHSFESTFCDSEFTESLDASHIRNFKQPIQSGDIRMLGFSLPPAFNNREREKADFLR
jgi:hypothetical protein